MRKPLDLAPGSWPCSRSLPRRRAPTAWARPATKRSTDRLTRRRSHGPRLTAAERRGYARNRRSPGASSRPDHGNEPHHRRRAGHRIADGCPSRAARRRARSCTARSASTTTSGCARRPNPEVAAYLEAENAYADAVMKPTEAAPGARSTRRCSAASRRPTSTCPTARAATSTTRAPRRASSTRSYCRKQGSLDGARGGHARPERAGRGARRSSSLGAYAVSDDGHLLAYSTDNTGFRQYTCTSRTCATGAAPGRRWRRRRARSPGPRTTGRSSTRSRTTAKRPLPRSTGTASARRTRRRSSTRRRTSRSTSASAARAAARTWSWACGSHTTVGGARSCRADEPAGEWRMVAPARATTRSTTSTTTATRSTSAPTTRGRNFRLVTAPVDAPRPRELDGGRPPPRRT